MKNHVPQSAAVVVHPALAALEWVWVLAAPRTKVSDALFVLELEEPGGRRCRVLPIFEAKDTASALKDRLCRERPGEHGPQAMLLSEVGLFAAEHSLEIMLLDADGVVLARLTI